MLINVFYMVPKRCFTTTNFACGVGSMMKKVLTKPRKQRKYFDDNKPIMSTTSSLGAITGDGHKANNSRRISVLNKLFMRHITDLMAGGTYSNSFTGHGIEINRVKVTPDYKYVKVYWLARSEKMVENIDEILKSHASALRHELCQLHVLGNVPKIQFVKDNHYTLLKLLDNKISMADYGEDHEPADSISKLKCELELQTSLASSVRKKIEQLDDEALSNQSEEVENVKFEIPDMPQNVLGLDHGNIMQRVLANVQKSQGLQRNSQEHLKMHLNLSAQINNDPISYPSMKVQREAFREFLNKRLASREKLKRNNDAKPELEFMEEEGFRKREEDLKKYDFYEYLANEKDFIDDFDENDNKER